MGASEWIKRKPVTTRFGCCVATLPTPVVSPSGESAMAKSGHHRNRVYSGGQAVVGVVETPRGWGLQEIGGSTSCKADYPCTVARDAGHEHGGERPVSHRQCRTAAAGCTVGSRQALRRVIATLSSTEAIPLPPLHAAARLPH